MRTTTLWAALATAVLALPVSAQAADPAADHAPAHPRAATVKPRSDHWEARVVALTNLRREAHGIKPLKAAAVPRPLRRALDAAPGDQAGAGAPGPRRRCCRARTRHAAGENIAYGYETPRALVSAWMHSPGHRANILNPHFHRIGVSGWRATNGTTYATQDFVG